LCDCIDPLSIFSNILSPNDDKHQSIVPPFYYGEQFYNTALGTNQTLRVLVPTNSTGDQFDVIYFLHPYIFNATREDMVKYLNETADFFTELMVCLSTTYGCFYLLDSACAVECLSGIPQVGGTTNAMYLLNRMGVTLSSELPFVPPCIIVLADFRSSFYMDRKMLPHYFPEQNMGDRAKRLLRGATGNYEKALLQVVKYVDSFYPT